MNKCRTISQLGFALHYSANILVCHPYADALHYDDRSSRGMAVLLFSGSQKRANITECELIQMYARGARHSNGDVRKRYISKVGN